MYLKDFAECRGLASNTIYRYIQAHPEIKKFTHLKGKSLVLDEGAVELLEKKYPLPQPVQIVEDYETIRELAECRKELVEAHKKLSEATILIAQAEAIKLRLEDREAELLAEKERYRELQEELAKERAKTWWQKLWVK